MFRIIPRRFLSTANWSPGMSKLRVSEMFSSIQGEGPHSGRPSVFLRLGVCNLCCVWCDTPYTWMFSEHIVKKVRKNIAEHSWQSMTGADPPMRVYDKESELEYVALDDVRTRILTLAKPATKAVVITGGEPLLHAKPLIELVPQLLADGFEIEFETNGTISPDGIPDKVHFNVSPKLSNSIQRERTRINYPVLTEIMSRPSAVLKFVVDEADDLAEVNNIVAKLGVGKNRVFLMPQGKESEELAKKGAWLADVCRMHGYNYSHRIHVELWGNRRGV